ncbi:B12-binding domain-containing radical SAM protein [Gemmata sp.]|uniref:B12-binding domain-containing radical SAM protein n=1 Tax=Gemmata sp. TaxID=1914242 RepID=UPI003F702769
MSYNRTMDPTQRRTAVLVQLPIPPLGPAAVRGNVPLAGAYLKLWAEKQGLGRDYDIQVFPGREANALGDHALVAALLARDPWMLGFTCYVWNIERTLWVAAELKRLRPDLVIVLGGPEITPDNAWVLDTPHYDHAVIGEGEQTFAALLEMLRDTPKADRWSLPLAASAGASHIPGLYTPAPTGPRYDPARRPLPRTPLQDLNQLGSPYLAGLLDPGEEQMLLLETTRGCVFKCKFCYYPKSYDKQYYIAHDEIRAGLRLARERGVKEVFLLDPTLNQRRDFAEFLTLLAEENPGHGFSYFGELRGEGVTPQTARLLREANFSEVEVGLQSIDPDAMRMMDRKNNLKAFERGVRAMREEGIRVKVDLIVGLPGDTRESVRRSFHYLRDGDLYSDVQVFNLAILPGTAFRQEAPELGIRFQPRPPYYVLETPTLKRTDLFELMREAQESFDVEFDAQTPPVLDFDTADGPARVWKVDLDAIKPAVPPHPARRAQAFTLWLTAAHLARHADLAARCIKQVLAENPYTTLQVVLDATTGDPAALRESVTPALLESLLAAALERPTYLDKYYALQPGRTNGAKRLVLILPGSHRDALDTDWVDAIGATASLVWRGLPECAAAELETFEYAWPG